ncbi:MAG: murein biosynthesis integral membrane protein MurJ [Pseudomonadales bacterium]|nr:murein biosynthesis integral membrane protein MurJ [Pseudomonadales bacterium]
MNTFAFKESCMAGEEVPKNEAEKAGQQEAGLIRSGLVVSAMTFLSRVLGQAREIVFAAIFGDGPEADAFFVAFKIPNFLRRLFAEGAFSQAFVPVLSEYRKTRTLAEVKLLLDHVLGSLGLILLVITVLGVAAAPLLAALFAPGYLASPAQFALLVEMLRITFPYILLISLTGFAGSILNSYGRFAIPAMTPVFLNISLISCALLLSPLLEVPVMALAWGVLLAGIIQLMFQLPFLHHLQLFPRPRLNKEHEGVKRIIALMLPVMFSVSVGQINLLLDTVLATTLVSGSVSWLYYSDRLMELPLGIFAIAIATVILPSLSRIHAAQTPERFVAMLAWALRLVLLVGVPASVALIALAEPLIITLYQRGAFTLASVSPTAMSLQAYAIGLLGFMSIKILATAYFARQDTLTPVRYGVIAMVSNMVFNLLLILPLAHVGLALATSLSAFINAGLLLRGLLQKDIFHFPPGWPVFVARIIVANGVMLLVLMLLAGESAQWLAWGELERIGKLALVCGAGMLSYLLALLLLGLRPAQFRH